MRRHLDPAWPNRGAVWLLAAVATAFIWLSASTALAQDANIRFGQSLRLAGSELEVTADQLEVDQQSGTTVFAGNVLVIQGELRMTADRLVLEYRPGGSQGERRIDRLVATGGVTLVTPDEALEAQEAIYGMTGGTLEMRGEVLLVQGANVLSGERFSADLNTGSGRMSGRVRTVIRLD